MMRLAPLCFVVVAAGSRLVQAQPPDQTPASAAQAPETGTPNADVPSQGDGEPNADEMGREEFELGRSFYDQGNYAEAAVHFQRALDLTGRPQLYYNVGLTQDRLRHDEAALVAYERYLSEVEDPPQRVQVEARVRALRDAEARRASERESEIEAAERLAREEAERDAAESEGSLWWVGVLVGAVVLVGAGVGIAIWAAGREPDYQMTDFESRSEVLRVAW